MGVEFFKNQIERASRNYDINQGRETTKVTTATGLAMMRQDAQSQADIKGADRDAGFERLYELLDWLALEFFDDDRMLFIGADEMKDRAPQAMPFNADSFTAVMPKVLENCDIDPEIYSGFAFGVGLERLVMRRFQISDMRLLYENDTRFLSQF